MICPASELIIREICAPVCYLLLCYGNTGFVCCLETQCCLVCRFYGTNWCDCSTLGDCCARKERLADKSGKNKNLGTTLAWLGVKRRTMDEMPIAKLQASTGEDWGLALTI